MGHTDSAACLPTDPFGHSNQIAPLYNMTGFDAWYINRIDYRLQVQSRPD